MELCPASGNFKARIDSRYENVFKNEIDPETAAVDFAPACSEKIVRAALPER